MGKILIDFWNTREETLSVAKLTSEPSCHWKPANKAPWRGVSSTAKLSSLATSEASTARLGNPDTSASMVSLAPSETSSTAAVASLPGAPLPAEVPGGIPPGAPSPVKAPGGTPVPVEVPGGIPPGASETPGTPRSSTPSIMVGESASGPPTEAEMVAMNLGRLEVGENRRVSERVSDRFSDRVDKLDDEPESPSAKSEGRAEEASYRLNPK